MARNDNISFEGKVTKILPGTKFEVEIKMPNDQAHKVVATLSGRLRQNSIKIILEDLVTVEISPYDLSKGIIVWRDK